MNLVQKQMQSVTQANQYRDSHNPLRNLTMSRAVSMMEQAQSGIYADLMWTYGAETGIESTDADLMVIVERSLASVSDTEWQIEQIDSDTRNFDQALADEQESCLREHYESCQNIRDAFEHLAMARFRGFAHVNPQFSASGILQRLEPVDQWNIGREGSRGAWYYNPQALQCDVRTLGSANRLSPTDYLVVEWNRPVNRIGLIKFVRQSTAEKDWDYFVECFGLPGSFVIMPAVIPPGQEEAYRAAAEEASKGGSGALPNGSEVKTPGDTTRGSSPFQPRLEWLQKQLVLAGTGGLLTVLAESGSGTLAGSVHEQAFRQIGRALTNRISEAFQSQFDRRILAARFPGRPVLAYFQLQCRQQKITAEIVKDFAALAPFFDLDPEEVSRETGYTILSQRAAPASAPAAALARAKPGPSAQATDQANVSLAAVGTRLYSAATQAGFKPLAQALWPLLDIEDPTALAAALQAVLAQFPAMSKTVLAATYNTTVLSDILAAAAANGLAEARATLRASAPLREKQKAYL